MWAVQIEGSNDFLKRLERNLQTPDLRCFSKNNRFYLLSKTFQNNPSYETVYHEAKEIISVITGIATINLNLWPSSVLQIVSIAELDDEMKIIKHYACSDLAIRARGRSDLNSENNPFDDLEKWITLASTCEVVAKVFRLLRFGIDDYVNSYRVYEIIYHDMDKKLCHLGIDNADLRRFKATSNNPSLSGDQSRHGFVVGDTPNQRLMMSPGEVETFIYRIVYKWIHYKL